MANLKFANPEVEAKYECLVEKDRKVDVAGQYGGPLSKITLEVADGMVKRGSNLLKLKGTAKPAATPQPQLPSGSGDPDKR